MANTPKRPTTRSTSRNTSEEPTPATLSTPATPSHGRGGRGGRGSSRGKGSRGRKISTPAGGRPPISAQESTAYGSAGRPDSGLVSLDPMADIKDVGTAMEQAVEQAQTFEQDVQNAPPGIIQSEGEEEVQEPIILEKASRKTPQPDPELQRIPGPNPTPPKPAPPKVRGPQQIPRHQQPGQLEPILEEDDSVSSQDDTGAGKLVDETEDEFSGNFGTEGRLGSSAALDRERKEKRRQERQDRREQVARSHTPFLTAMKWACWHLLTTLGMLLLLYLALLLLGSFYPGFQLRFGSPSPFVPPGESKPTTVTQLPPALGQEIELLQSQVEQIKSEIKKVNRQEIKLLDKKLRHVQSELEHLKQEQSKYSIMVESSPASPTTINYFSPGNGAVINTYLTSAQYEDLYVSKWDEFLAYVHGKNPKRGHGPMKALTPSEDIGDCFCGPQPDGKVQVAVTVAHKIFPQELVVEHIHRNETPNIGAAPRDIEIWAQIPDHRERDQFISHAYNNFQQDSIQKDNEPPYPENDAGKLYQTTRELDETWVRLGIYRYDIYGKFPTQTFNVPADLEILNIPVKFIVFRARNNWGDSSPNTCIYRLKLHGKLADDEPKIKPAEEVGWSGSSKGKA
ncbi:MAG: hypothetical protein MMC33_010148 [Icmadophila ericetorum]|nr:hypothetical protein [Icmadophila ericetorum]